MKLDCKVRGFEPVTLESIKSKAKRCDYVVNNINNLVVSDPKIRESLIRNEHISQDLIANEVDFKGSTPFINKGVVLPLRKTTKSSGYDFFSTTYLIIQPKKSVLLWTNVKAYMQEDEELVLDVRSSIGIQRHLMLANIHGKIDSDYYNNPDNEGNIGICLYNYGNEIEVIEAGERIVQGTFRKYLIADNCNGCEKRIGGIGSTNK